jgi:Mn-dependent DtxR family transcriptional regulator
VFWGLSSLSGVHRVADEAAAIALLLVDALAENPFVTAKNAAARMGVAFTTAQRAVAALERRGVLEHVGGGTAGQGLLREGTAQDP